MQHSAVVECPKSMVGRVIGKGGETIKALQQYTGAIIQVDQSREPTRVTISGSTRALSLASSMVQDIVAGQFKGFAMLRSVARTSTHSRAEPSALLGQLSPVYVEGYGFVPPSQDTALLGSCGADSAFSPQRGGLPLTSLHTPSALSHFARLRLEATQPIAHHQLQKQLFAGLETIPSQPGGQFGTSLQSQQLMQQLSLLLQQQQSQQQPQPIQQQQAQPTPSLSQVGLGTGEYLNLLTPNDATGKALPLMEPPHFPLRPHPFAYEPQVLPVSVDPQAVDSRSDSVESSYSSFGLPPHAYGPASLGGLAATSLPSVSWS